MVAWFYIPSLKQASVCSMWMACFAFWVTASSHTLFGDTLILRESFPCMGTEFTIQIECEPRDSSRARLALEAASVEGIRLEKIFSDYLPQSELNQLTQRGEWQSLSPELSHIFAQSRQWFLWSEGRFDITAASVSQLWRRARAVQKVPSETQIQKALSQKDPAWLQLEPDDLQTWPRRARVLHQMPLDLGGMAKGWTAYHLLHQLAEHGFPHSVVAASGDLAIGKAPRGKEGWPISLKDPSAPTEHPSPLRLTLKECSVSTSGDLHQFLEVDGIRYSHIFDAKTGKALNIRRAATMLIPHPQHSKNPQASKLLMNPGGHADAGATVACLLAQDEIENLAQWIPGSEWIQWEMTEEGSFQRHSSSFFQSALKSAD